MPADDNVTSAINAVNLENVLRDIQTNRDTFVHRTAPFLVVHVATTLWHIAMPVVGAVHSIKSRHSNAKTAVMLFWALMASGQITMRRVDGWQTLGQAPVKQPIDLAA